MNHIQEWWNCLIGDTFISICFEDWFKLNYCIITFEWSRIYNLRNCLSPSGMDNHHNSTRALAYQLGGLYGVSPVTSLPRHDRSTISDRASRCRWKRGRWFGRWYRSEDSDSSSHCERFRRFIFPFVKLNEINEYKRMAYLYVKMTSSKDGKLVWI